MLTAGLDLREKSREYGRGEGKRVAQGGGQGSVYIKGFIGFGV